MDARHALAQVGALVGDASRASILLALLGGVERPAGELARVAGISAAATSLHLGKLLAGELVAVRGDGRHRYYRLAGPMVARALESLGAIASKPSTRAISPEHADLRAARSCYDHLAGELGVALADLMIRERVLRADGERAYRITERGVGWIARAFELDVGQVARGRRDVARRCLDWTARRPHLAGALGAAILARMIERRWVRRRRDTRALRITVDGCAALARLGVCPESGRWIPKPDVRDDTR
jgi:DNA-binding transcriptional ArsR family regulator